MSYHIGVTAALACRYDMLQKKKKNQDNMVSAHICYARRRLCKQQRLSRDLCGERRLLIGGKNIAAIIKHNNMIIS